MRNGSVLTTRACSECHTPSIWVDRRQSGTYCDSWRNISITLKTPFPRSMSVIACYQQVLAFLLYDEMACLSSFALDAFSCSSTTAAASDKGGNTGPRH